MIQYPSLPPALLVVGSPAQQIERAERLVHDAICPQGHACASCTVHRQIAARQHVQLTWLQPEKTYKLEDIEPIMATLAFTQLDDCAHVFVLQRAEDLSAVCGNNLLKVVEEPPRGYHFIFLAESATQVLPTIVSRCIVETIVDAPLSLAAPRLLAFFTDGTTSAHAMFAKEIEQFNERTSVQELERFIVHWAHRSRQDVSDQLATRLLTLFQEAYQESIMPGSAKLFWKNLWLKTRV